MGEEKFAYTHNLRWWQRFRITVSWGLGYFRWKPFAGKPVLIANFTETGYEWLGFSVIVVRLGVEEDKSIDFATFKARKTANNLRS